MLLRPVAHPREWPALEELFRECQRADGHHPLTEPLVLEVAAGPQGPGLGIVAEEDGRIRGYAHAAWIDRVGVWSLGVAVEPRLRGATAMALIDLVLGAAGDTKPGDVILWVFDEWLARVAAAGGFVQTRELRKLSLSLPPADAPAVPDWIDLRPFRPDEDEDAWLEVNNAAFRGHPENGAWDRAVLAERMRLPWFEAEGLLLAWHEQRLAGFCWTKRHGDGVGEIYVIGVHPDYQRRGLGRELVLAGLWHLTEHDSCDIASLFVDIANTGGIGIYASLGFQLERLDRSFVSKVPKR